MPLSDLLDEVLALSRQLDRAERMARANVPFGQVDPAPIRAELEAAKKAFLEDCLSKWETIGYLRELQARLEMNLQRGKECCERSDEPKAYGSMKYYEGAVCYVRDCADDIENGVAVPKAPDPPSHVSAPK